jgi:hypothetical protein
VRPLLKSLVLVVLAPTVGEFLLGNIPISQYASVLVLCPLYGAGALLIREVARRLQAGWPTIALFAAAYALVEEGPVDQMIFNPGYLGYHSFAGYGEIPGLGISGTLLLASLALHTVWSICVPVAIMESFGPNPDEPWLGRAGLVVTAAAFVAGCVFLGVEQARALSFVGTPAQFAASSAAIVALVAAGVLAGRRPPPQSGSRPAPLPVTAGAAAFAWTSAYWLSAALPGGDTIVGNLLCWSIAVVPGAVVVRRWSRRAGWGAGHRLGLAGGATATYALWFGPSQAVEAGTSPAETAAGAVVFGFAVLVLIVLAHRAIMRAS